MTHLNERLAGHQPEQLRMIIYDEGGTWKSEVIQTVTEYFKAKGVAHLLLKCAYTGVAASLIEGKTLNSAAHISVTGKPLSDASKVKLEDERAKTEYFILDEISTVGRPLFATSSRNFGGARMRDYA